MEGGYGPETDWSCSEEQVDTKAIEIMRNNCVETSTDWVTTGTLLNNDINKITNCVEVGKTGLIRFLNCSSMICFETTKSARNRTHHYN